MKLKDLTNKKFGRWTVLFRVQCDRKQTKWRCKCECGIERDVFANHLTRGNSLSCGCGRPKKHEKPNWTGYGEISGDFWRDIERGANGEKGRKPINFDIAIEDMWELFLLQDRKCALSGLSISMNYRGQRYSSNGKIHTASLDRIDSSLGYVEGNVQWVHKDINMMKRIYDQDYFIELCKLVATNN